MRQQRFFHEFARQLRASRQLDTHILAGQDGGHVREDWPELQLQSMAAVLRLRRYRRVDVE